MTSLKPITIETERIRAKPHADVARILIRDSTMIVERWCEQAKAEQPTAARVHHDVIRNQLDDVLLAMGRGLSQAGERNPTEHRNTAIEHGEHRWDNGWSIVELTRDYQILHSVVLAHLSSTLKRPLNYEEVMAIGVFIHDAVAASVSAYVANRDHELRDVERRGIEALQEAYRRKDEFLAVVVHELRNPVGAIANAADILAQLDPSLTGGQDPVRMINRQTRHLLRILDDITDLTRLARGHLELEKTIVDMTDVIEQAVQVVEPLVRKSDHHLSVNVPAPGVLTVKGDVTRLVQVFVNLLNNATKYTPRGGRISVACLEQGDQVRTSVRDTGVGVPANMTSRIFDMYTRVTDATDRPTDGLGIGLALVQHLVALHGGTVTCMSDGTEKGSEFVVLLPSAAMDRRPAESASA